MAPPRRFTAMLAPRRRRHRHRFATALVVTLLASALSGCLESTDFICYRPGVYQGAADPLLGAGAVDTAALQARFARQTDR